MSLCDLCLRCLHGNASADVGVNYGDEIIQRWSSQWCSGHPRMLLELILEFESNVGRPLEFSSISIYQRNQLLRARANEGRRKSMRADEPRKGWCLVEIKMKARAVVGRGREEYV